MVAWGLLKTRMRLADLFFCNLMNIKNEKPREKLNSKKKKEKIEKKLKKKLTKKKWKNKKK